MNTQTEHFTIDSFPFVFEFETLPSGSVKFRRYTSLSEREFAPVHRLHLNTCEDIEDRRTMVDRTLRSFGMQHNEVKQAIAKLCKELSK